MGLHVVHGNRCRVNEKKKDLPKRREILFLREEFRSPDGKFLLPSSGSGSVSGSKRKIGIDPDTDLDPERSIGGRARGWDAPSCYSSWITFLII
ncbi:MAG TPA: hypothetical protein PKM41_02400 [Deltaproteobacteria bacterium]|nr:hypothetical protein [Deltaproteobacteria bacterium]HOI05615.1 hypothetical protein [Deltaproteobacteria bacterium]